jgi:hypothetical protein
LPGAYILETKPVDETDDHPPLVGWQSISVGDEDLERVVVEMKAPIELRGKIIAEGTPPSPWPQITLSPMEGLNYLDSAVIDEAGHFAIAGLEPAPYNLTVGIVPSPMFVKSIRVNGHDLAGGDLDFASAPAASVEIVMSSGTSSISGVVSDSGGPVGAVTVMATNRSRQPTYRITRTDENGKFSFGGLPPGDYFLAATDIGDEPLISPDVLAKLGKTVSVDDGAAAAIDLRLITTDDLRAANSSQ